MNYRSQATRSYMEQVNDKTNTEVLHCGNLHERRFKTILFIFRLGGVPIKLKSVSRVNRVYNATMIACFYITLVSVFMDTFVHRHQLEYTMKRSRALLGLMLVSWVHLSSSYHKSDIEHLLRLTDAFTWEELPTRHPDTGYLTKAGYIPIIQTVAAYVIVLAIVYHTVQCTVRIVLNHDMIMANWYPFDASVSPMYEIANLTQALISIIILCLYFGFPSLYATLVCVACSQLEKLRAELLDIGQTHLMSEQDCGDWARQTDGPGRAHTSDEVFRHMQQKLKDCIRHHQQIKRFMEALEDTMNLPLCGILFLLLIMLCFDAFSAVTSWGDYNDISQAAVVYIFATGSVCAYCWLGNELSEQAEMIRDAAWGCDWVGTPVPFQRCLVFIIAAVNKEFTLTAGKFVPVCNKTMMNMMNQSISFFMFLLHVKDKSATNQDI